MASPRASSPRAPSGQVDRHGRPVPPRPERRSLSPPPPARCPLRRDPTGSCSRSLLSSFFLPGDDCAGTCRMGRPRSRESCRSLEALSYSPGMTLGIRRATLDDLPVISALAGRIWRAHYPGILPGAQLEYMLNPMYDIDQLRRAAAAGVVYERLGYRGRGLGCSGAAPISA